MSQVQDRIAQDDQQFFVLPCKNSSKRGIPGLYNYLVSDPLPKLGLGRPELFTVAANDQSRSLLFFLQFLYRSRSVRCFGCL